MHVVPIRKRLRFHPPEALLQRVERQAAELRRNQVGPVLHDLFEAHMLLGALPARNKVEHVLALGGLAVLLALGARQLHAERLEDGFLLLCNKKRDHT